MPRYVRLLGVALGLALLSIALWLLPSVMWVLPHFVRSAWFQWMIAALVAIEAVARRRGVGPRVFAFLDQVGMWLIKRVLPLGLALVCAVLLAGWAPQYVTWPWCRDVDTFATLAQGWTMGVVPYRDVLGYNFPGHIYLHMLLGSAFGWGRPRVFYAVDVAILAGMGLWVVAWSRRCLGGALPGLVGFLGVLATYLNLEFEQVAERDWHVVYLSLCALAIVQARPRGRGRLLSACLMGIALVIRPHACLFMPAILFALPALQSRLRWLGTVIAVTLALFLPVVFSGALPAFLGGLRVAAYGGAYGRTAVTSPASVLWQQLSDRWTLAALVLLAVASWRSDMKAIARAWLLALLGAIAYRPIHPVQHAYLEVPLLVTRAVAWSIPVAWVVRSVALPGVRRLLILALLVHQAMPAIPRFWDPEASWLAVGPLVRGEPVPRPPLGSLRFFHRLASGSRDRPYEWSEYHHVMAYLRRTTREQTAVANVLRRIPFPGLNGTIGRISPFRAESGICWMWLVDLDFDAEFARQLESTVDSVVVWVPDEQIGEPWMRLPRLVETIRRLYEPEARFDNIEVWRRKAGSGVSESDVDPLTIEPIDGAAGDQEKGDQAREAPPEG